MGSMQYIELLFSAYKIDLTSARYCDTLLLEAVPRFVSDVVEGEALASPTEAMLLFLFIYCLDGQVVLSIRKRHPGKPPPLALSGSFFYLR